MTMLTKKSALRVPLLVAMGLGFAVPADSFGAITITGFGDVVVDEADAANKSLTSLTFGSASYGVSEFVFGTTTRYYSTDGTAGSVSVWDPDIGGAVPGDAVAIPGSSTIKAGDFGSKSDDTTWILAGTNDMSSLDGIAYQQTLFSSPVSVIFVFERGGNDTGTIQPIYEGDILGAAVDLTAGSSYADTGVSVNGQNAFGYVVEDLDSPMVGIQINAPGHDALSVLTIVPEPGVTGLFGLGLVGLLLSRRRRT